MEVFSVISFGILAYCIHLLRKDIQKVLDNVPIADGREQLTSYELERLEREEQFDDRINRLKEELALQQQTYHTPTVADELHPLVKNLPHNAIKTKNNDLPDVEYSE